MADNNYGLDIGSENIRISSLEGRTILSEKNVITIRDNKLILGYTDEAYEMFEKAPENVDVVFPVENGSISNIKRQQLILNYMYQKINHGKHDKNSNFLISVPNDTAQVEKRAFYSICASPKIKPRNISMIDQPIADAIACHLNVEDDNGNIIVNIGAGSTNVSVIARGGILFSKKIAVSGNHISEAIINAVKASQNKLIGMKMADLLKSRLCDLSDDADDAEMTLYARQMASGLPVKTKVNSNIVNKAVKDSLRPLADVIVSIIEKTPLEISEDIQTRGIYLVGGCANLINIDVFLRKLIDVPVNILNDPSNSTIRGITKVLSSPIYDKYRYYPEERIFD